jgi:hypothetical protein
MIKRKLAKRIIPLPQAVSDHLNATFSGLWEPRQLGRSESGGKLHGQLDHRDEFAMLSA